MAPDEIDYPQPHLLLSLLLIVTILAPLMKVLRPLKGKPISNPTHTASANGMKIVTIGKDSVPVCIMDIAPTTPQSTGKLHHLSTLFGRYLRSRGCIPLPNWLTSWPGTPLCTPSLHPERRRECPLPSETGWLASWPSTAGIPQQKYGRGYDRHEQQTRKAIPSDQTD